MKKFLLFSALLLFINKIVISQVSCDEELRLCLKAANDQWGPGGSNPNATLLRRAENFCHTAWRRCTGTCELRSVNPSPNNGRFSIDYHAGINGNVRINIYDNMGTKVYTKQEAAIKWENTYVVRIPKPHAGIYMAEVRHGHNIRKIQFLVQ